jgi:hypothetical protein
MRTKFIALTTVPFFLSCPAHAQKAAPADLKIIDTCLKKAESEGNAGFNCIGAIADPCIKGVKQTNDDVEASKKCAARELAVWNELMPKALARVKKGGFKETEKATGPAQSTWIESVKSLCPVFDAIEPGMFLGGAVYCRLQETARRTVILQRLSDAVNER